MEWLARDVNCERQKKEEEKIVDKLRAWIDKRHNGASWICS